MGRVSAEDWEHVVTRDLLPFLGFGIDLKPRGTQFPVGSTGLPDGAYEDLSADVGRLGAEDLLVVPPAAWMVDRLRYRCLCMPLQIAGIGERAAGLWVRALPAPGVRVQVPVNGIAAVESVADGRRRLLVVTGQGARLAVRYSSDADAGVGAWARRVRVRAAGQPSPVPVMASALHENLEAFLLGPDDYGVSVRWRSYAGSSACMLALTSRELVAVRSWRRPGPPWGRVNRSALRASPFYHRRCVADPDRCPWTRPARRCASRSGHGESPRPPRPGLTWYSASLIRVTLAPGRASAG